MIPIALIVMVSQCMAFDSVMSYELCNRTIAAFDLINAVVQIKAIDGTIIQAEQLTYQDYQALKTYWPDHLFNLGLDIPVCNNESNEFDIHALGNTGAQYLTDKVVKMSIGAGQFYQTILPESLEFDDLKITGIAQYSSDNIDLKNLQIEPDAHVMLNSGKIIVLKDGFHAKQGCYLRIFGSGN
jgi:hypothetical protein